MKTYKSKLDRLIGYWEPEEFGFQNGTIMTPFGYVIIYRQTPEPTFKFDPWTQFRFAHNGYEYRRRADQVWSKRFTLTLARRFAEDVVYGRI